MLRNRVLVIGTLVLILLVGTTIIALAAASGPPTEDANVYASDSGLTQNDGNLRTEAGDPTCAPARWSYLKWNLGDVPPGATIGSAVITLYVNLINGPTGSAQLSLYKIEGPTADGWSETSVTSANGPTLLPANILQSVSIPTVGNTVTFNNSNLVDFLQQEADGDNTASFGLGLTGNCGNASLLVRMSSKEPSVIEAQRPRLQITDPNAVTLRAFRSDDPVVSPVIFGGAAIALLAVVAGVFVARRRRLAN